MTTTMERQELKPLDQITDEEFFGYYKKLEQIDSPEFPKVKKLIETEGSDWKRPLYNAMRNDSDFYTPGMLPEPIKYGIAATAAVAILYALW